MADESKKKAYYDSLVRAGVVPPEVSYDAFNLKIRDTNFAKIVYSGLKTASELGIVKDIPSEQQFNSVLQSGQFPTEPEISKKTNQLQPNVGATQTNQPQQVTPTTETDVVAEEETPQQGVPARAFPSPEQLRQPVTNQPLPSVGMPPTNQPQPTAEETQIAPIDQQAGQVQGGMPQGQGLGAGQFQITDIRTQAEKPQSVPTMPRMEPIQQTTTTPTGQATPLTSPPSEQVGFMDYLGNAVQRGLNRGEIADYISATGKTPTAEEFARIAELNAENERLFTSKAMQDFSSNPDLESTLKSLPEIAVESIASLYRHGLARMATGAVAGGVAGSVIPLAGTLSGAGTGILSGMSVAGLGLEVSGTIMEGLNELKINTKDPEALKTAFSNPAVMDYLKQKAYARGIPIAAINAVSMGVAGKLIGKPVASAVGRGLQVLGEAGIQGVLGASGEAYAQMFSGEKFKPYDILAEGLAEIPGSIPEVGIAVLSKNKGAGKDTKVESARLALKSPDMPIEAINEVIDVGVGTGEINATQATELKQEVAKAREIDAKIPAEIKDTELRVAAIGLIEERDNLNAQLESVDEAFKPAIQEKIKGINEQLQELSQIPQQQGTQAFFETNQPSQTNPLLRLPESVDAVMDKIDQGVLVSAESLFDVYNNVQTAIRETLANRAITPEERSATINILSGMLTDIDRANTEGQRFVEQVEEVSVQDRVPAVREGVKPLPQGQAPKGTATPSISQAKAIREENKKKQAGTNVLPSSGQTIVTPAPTTEAVATETEVVPEGSDVILEKANNATVPEGKGTWRKEFNESKDFSKKSQILEVLADSKTSTENELRDIYEAAKITEPQTNRVNVALARNPNTPQDIFDDLIQSKKLEKTLSDGGIDELIQRRKELQPTSSSPQAQSEVTAENPALADVESTAKALEGVDKETEDLSTALMVAEGSLKNNDLRKSKQRDKFIPIIKSLLKEGEYIGQSFKGQTSESASNSISQTISSAYHSAKAKPESERTAQETELITQVEQLLTPTQDAVQKQTAGQVPVQSGTTSSQEVAKGEPQAEPQSTADKGQAQETGKEEVGKQAPAKKTLSEEFGVSADDVNNLVEQKRKTFEGYSVEMALQELGVPQDKIKDALPAYVAEMLEGTLPTKSPVKKQKISEDLIPEGEIKIQPIPSKGKGKPAKTTAEKIDLVSDATDNKSDRDYAKVVHKNADNKEVVATDAHVMIVVKDDSITETESVDVKTGQKADVRYPDYKSVIPDTAKRKDKKKVNAKTIYDLASGIAKATKMFTGRIIPARIVIGDTELFVPAENLKRGLEPFVRSGITDIEISVDGPNRAVVFKGGDITSIVMPVQHKGENAGYTTIISEEQATPTTKQQAAAQTKPTAETVATTTETTGQEGGEVKGGTTTTEVTLTPINATDVETITKIENATEKGRELALAKPVNKWVKRAFDTYEDISSRAKKAGIYDGKTLKIGGQEIELDTPAKFKAFLAQSQNNFDAINEAVNKSEIDTLKAERDALVQEFIKGMGKATMNLNPQQVSILAQLAWKNIQIIAKQSNLSSSAIASLIKRKVDEAVAELNQMLTQSGQNTINPDKEDITNVINNVRKLAQGIATTSTSTAGQIGTAGQSSATQSPIYTKEQEELAREKARKMDEGKPFIARSEPFWTAVKRKVAELRQKLDSPKELLNFAERMISTAPGTSYKRTRELPLGRAMEQLRGKARSLALPYMERISEALKPIENNLSDFEKYLIYRRIIDRAEQDKLNQEGYNQGLLKDRPKRRNTGGMTETDADILLNDLANKLGTKVFNQFIDAADNLQVIFDDNLKDLVDAGVLTQDRYNAIKSQNEFYVPFDVVQRDFRGNVITGTEYDRSTAQGQKVIQEIKGIDTPKNAAEANDAIDVFYKMMQKGDIDVDSYYYLATESITDARNAGNITQQEYESLMDALSEPGLELHSPLNKALNIINASQYQVARQGYMNDIDMLVDADKNNDYFVRLEDGDKLPSGMSVITYYKDGVQQRVAVDTKLKQAIDGMTKPELNAFEQALKIGSIPFKMAATSASITFLPVNFVIDTVRTLTSKAGLGSGANITERAASVIQIPVLYSEALVESIIGNLLNTKLGNALGLKSITPEFMYNQYEDWRKSPSYSEGTYMNYFTDKLKSGRTKSEIEDAKFLETVQRRTQTILGKPETAKAIANAMLGAKQKTRMTVDGLFDIINLVSKILENSHKIYGNIKLSGTEAGVRKGLDRYIGGYIDKLHGQKKLTQAELENALEEINDEVLNNIGSPNFEQIPPNMRAASILLSFFGAAVKGNMTDISRMLNSVNTGASKKERKDALVFAARNAAVFTIPAFMTGLAMALKDDDDESKKMYDEMDENSKWKNMIIPIQRDVDGKGVQTDFITIPIRGIPVIFNSIGRASGQALGMAMKEKLTKEELKNISKDLLYSSGSEMMTFNLADKTYLSDIDPETGERKERRKEEEWVNRSMSAISGLNPLIKAPLERVANKNFFGKYPLFPENIRGKRLRNAILNEVIDPETGEPISPSLLKNKFTPEYSVNLSKKLERNGIRVSPIAIDHFFDSFLAGAPEKYDVGAYESMKRRFLWKERKLAYGEKPKN